MASTCAYIAQKLLAIRNTIPLMFLDGCEWRRLTRSNKCYKVAQVLILLLFEFVPRYSLDCHTIALIVDL